MESNPISQGLQEEKAQLEIERLRLEVAQLQAPWWKSPSYLAVLIPIAISTFTLLGVWGKGWFDEQRKVLENKKQILESQVKKLEQEKDSLEKAIAIADDRLLKAQGEASRLRGEKVNLDIELTATRKEVGKLDRRFQSMVNGLNGALDRSVNEKLELSSLLSIHNTADPIYRLQSQYGWKISSSNRIDPLGYYLVISHPSVNSGRSIILCRVFDLQKLKSLYPSDWGKYIAQIGEPVLVVDYSYFGLHVDEQATVGGTLYGNEGEPVMFYEPLHEWAKTLGKLIR